LIPVPGASTFRFADKGRMLVEVRVPWDHPAFRRRGVRYVLFEGNACPEIQDDARLRPLVRSLRYGRTIYEVVGSEP
jgi:hypothetical protein